MTRFRVAPKSPMQKKGARSSRSGRGSPKRWAARFTTRGEKPFWKPLKPSA